jgi:hypothetical protein
MGECRLHYAPARKRLTVQCFFPSPSLAKLEDLGRILRMLEPGRKGWPRGYLRVRFRWRPRPYSQAKIGRASEEVELARAKVDRQNLVTQKIQTEQTIDARARRQPVTDDGKNEAVLT